MTTTYIIRNGEGATSGNTDTTTLNGAIRTIDTTGSATGYVISLTSDITLTSQLLAINLPSGATLTVEGANGVKTSTATAPTTASSSIPAASLSTT